MLNSVFISGTLHQRRREASKVVCRAIALPGDVCPFGLGKLKDTELPSLHEKVINTELSKPRVACPIPYHTFVVTLELYVSRAELGDEPNCHGNCCTCPSRFSFLRVGRIRHR